MVTRSQTVAVFVYGTLRTEPNGDEVVPLFTESARRIGKPGGWALPDYGIWGLGRSVPAVEQLPGHRVIGDLYRVTMAGFQALLRYEQFPGLYRYDEVEVHGLTTDDRHPAVVFATRSATEFGPLIPTGDFHRQTNQEVQMC